MQRSGYFINQNKTRKIGILGGSFDPIHMGHLNIARSARIEYGLDEVWFIPAGHSPNKNEAEMTPAQTRMRMAELAIEGEPYFRVSGIELESRQTSYTYRTLTYLQERYPTIQFFFIMGADSLDYFESWRHPEIICEKAVILVAVRDDMDLTEIQHKINFIQSLFDAEIYPVSRGRTAVSSTALRQRIREGQLDLSMLPERVAAYIAKHHLYGYPS